MSELNDFDHSQYENMSPEEKMALDSNQYIVFILDGAVQYVLGTDLLFSAVLQSNPIIKDITSRVDRISIRAGTRYDEKTDTFILDDNLF
jgi:hypothetical protein